MQHNLKRTSLSQLQTLKEGLSVAVCRILELLGTPPKCFPEVRETLASTLVFVHPWPLVNYISHFLYFLQYTAGGIPDSQS